MKKILFLAFTSLLLLGCSQQSGNQTIAPTASLPPSTPTPLPSTLPVIQGGECKTASDCIAAGCSGQLCISKSSKQQVSTCEFKEEYQCFDKKACGCVAGKCEWSPIVSACIFNIQEQQAINDCVSLCQKQKTDLRAGPCLSNQITENWVCDVAHKPREAVDEDPALQCPEYGKSAKHFVEVTPDCKLIRTA